MALEEHIFTFNWFKDSANYVSPLEIKGQYFYKYIHLNNEA